MTRPARVLYGVRTPAPDMDGRYLRLLREAEGRLGGDGLVTVRASPDARVLVWMFATEGQALRGRARMQVMGLPAYGNVIAYTHRGEGLWTWALPAWAQPEGDDDPAAVEGMALTRSTRQDRERSMPWRRRRGSW